MAQKRALSRGYLVPDEAGYAKSKAAAARHAAAVAPRTNATAAPRSPAFDGRPLRSWKGIEDANSSPTDSTSAIGTTSFIETINSKFAIYDRTSNAPLATGTLEALAGADPLEFGQFFDPQIIWDAGTSRFYYVMDDIVSSSDNRLEIGFSKTATPASAADFCHYFLGTGSEFYDYPKLGDTSNLWMVGSNVFALNGNYTRSDVTGITKPPSGSTCPVGSTFTVTTKTLTGSDSNPAFTPVPVNQTDPNSTGWIASAARFGTLNFVSVFQVTKDSTNHMVVGPAKRVPVAPFTFPANAVQKGSTNKLDSSDTRLTNAVSAFDPVHSSGVGIWTQHTVFGGPGAEVRWYEINPTPASPTPYQSGTAGSTALFAFNGAIAPDRRVNGTARNFGSSMVLGFNTSSSAQFPDIRAVSKRGTHAQSGQEIIVSGAGPHDDFTCASGVCRSGDYGGASPDPASDTSKSDGVVWQTNQLAGGSAGAAWHTWNFAGRPGPTPK